MKPLILVTRPAEDAGDTVEALTRLGYRSVCAPALAIHDTDTMLPDPSLAQGLIFSSANGVRAFQRRLPNPGFFTCPVFAVGEHTAVTAHAAGFSVVHAGPGAMQGLSVLIRQKITPPARLLHLRGRDMRADPATYLPRDEGWRIDGIALYAADVLSALLLPGEPIAAALFYSARSAAAFTCATQGRNFKPAKALCLAPSVVDSLNPEQWEDILVSTHPAQSGFMALLQGCDLQGLEQGTGSTTKAGKA